MIREGTAAHNLCALAPIITSENADKIMFCCDDKHPGDLLSGGHIDALCKRAVEMGANPLLTVRAATLNAARYFKLGDRGEIAPGYKADLVVLDNLRDFTVLMVIKNGEVIFNKTGLSSTAPDGKIPDESSNKKNGRSEGMRSFESPLIRQSLVQKARSTFHVAPLAPHDFELRGNIAVLGMVPGELTTRNCGYRNGANAVSIESDILKIAVIERHRNTGHIGVGLLQGYGLKSGAVATSIAHDSHNIVVVGCNDEDMAFAANRVIECAGGISVVCHREEKALVELPIAGIMSDEPLEVLSQKLEQAKAAATNLGVNAGIDPFMTLSFMSLTVIPELRITTKGMFDVTTQQFCEKK